MTTSGARPDSSRRVPSRRVPGSCDSKHQDTFLPHFATQAVQQTLLGLQVDFDILQGRAGMPDPARRLLPFVLNDPKRMPYRRRIRRAALHSRVGGKALVFSVDLRGRSGPDTLLLSLPPGPRSCPVRMVERQDAGGRWSYELLDTGLFGSSIGVVDISCTGVGLRVPASQVSVEPESLKGRALKGTLRCRDGSALSAALTIRHVRPAEDSLYLGCSFEGLSSGDTLTLARRLHARHARSRPRP